MNPNNRQQNGVGVWHMPDDTGRAAGSADSLQAHNLQHLLQVMGPETQSTHLERNLNSADMKLIKKIVKEAEVLKIRSDTTDASSDFDAIFNAYQKVLRANNIDPVHDEVYFKVVLMLAKMPGSTWIEKLQSLLSELPVDEEYTRLLQRKAILKERLKHYRLALSAFYLGKWIQKYNLMVDKVSALDKDCVLYVEDKYLSIWRKRFYQIAVTEAEADRKASAVVTNTMFSKWKSQLAHVRSFEEVAQGFCIKRMMNRWKNRRQVLAKRAIMAENLYSHALMKDALKSWKLRYVEQYIVAFRRKLLLSRCFTYWSSKTLSIVEAERNVTERNERDRLTEAFSNWEDSTRQIYTNMTIADEFLSKSLKQHAWSVWLRSFQLHEREKQFKRQNDKMLVLKVIRLWNKHTQDIQKAKMFYRRSLTSHHLKLMRLEMRYHQLTREQDMLTCDRILCHWIRVTRMRIFRRYVLMCQAKRIIAGWSMKTQLTRLKVQQMQTEREMHEYYTLRRNYLELWAKRSRTYQDMRDIADVHYQQVLSVKYFREVKKAALQNAQEYQKADQLAALRLTTQAWNHWRSCVETRKQAKLEHLCERWVNRRSEKLLINGFTLWLEKYRHTAQMASLAQSFVEEYYFVNLKSLHTLKWRTKYLSVLDLEETANETYSRSVERKMMNNWLQNFNRIAELNRILDEHAILRNLESVEKLFRKWTLRTLKLKSKARDAEEFRQRWDKVKFRNRWHSWVLSTQSKRSSTLSTSMSSFSISNADITLPATPTRIPGARPSYTPVSNQYQVTAERLHALRHTTPSVSRRYVKRLDKSTLENATLAKHKQGDTESEANTKSD